MAAGIAKLDDQSTITSGAKPPLDMGIRLRLSVMMFLQFAVWGSWFTVWSVYLKAPVAEGGLGFTLSQIGNLYGTMALGAIFSMLLAGQLADRVMSSEYLMAIFHIVGAFLLYLMATTHSYDALWWISLAYALVYNPTLSISNSLTFSHIPDATRDFPSLRVLGTIGWIAAGLGVSFLLPAHAQSTHQPLLMAAGLSAGLGLFCFLLPHTPPSGKTAGALPFLRALKLLLNPSFGILFAISFIITIALAFYYTFAGTFLDSAGVKDVAAVMTIGQGSEIGFMLLLPYALKRFGMKGVLSIGMAAWALRYGFFSIGTPYILLILAVALHGVCFDFFLAAGFIYTDNKAPVAIRGSAQALFSFLTYGVGMWIGNLVFAAVGQHFTVGGVTQWPKVWMAPAIGAVACLALFLVLWKDTPGKVEEIEAPGFAVEPLV